MKLNLSKQALLKANRVFSSYLTKKLNMSKYDKVSKSFNKIMTHLSSTYFSSL